MFPLESSNPTIADLGYFNIAEAQGKKKKKLKTTFMNMIEVLKEEMDKPHKEIYNYTNSGRK